MIRTALPASAWGADAARIAAREAEAARPNTAQVVARAHAIIQAAGLDPATVRPETWFTAADQARNELWLAEVHALVGQEVQP